MDKETEKTEDEVGTGASETGDAVLKTLKGSPANTDVEVAGERVNAREAFEKFKEALALVKKYLGDVVDIDLSKIEFRKLEGNLVGEAVERATLLDPALFRHPAFVIAQVVAHELLHKNTRIPNEALVQAAVERVFGKNADVQHSYDQMVTDFHELAGRFDEHGDADAGIERIYELYDREDFEGIFEEYERNYIDGLKTDAEKDEAFEFYLRVFPELEYDGEKLGYSTVKVLEDKDAEVVDLNEYRDRVSTTESAIIDNAA